MIYNLPKPMRRAIALGLLGLVVGSAGLFIVRPVWFHISNLKDSIEQERMMTTRLLALANDDSARQSLEQQTKAAKALGLFIEGESESIRLAALQSSLSSIAAANGVKLRSSRNLPGREKGDLRLAGVQLQLAAPIEKLQKILFDIEQSKPSLFVDSLQVTPVAVSRVVDDDQPGLLDARFDVFAVEARQKG